MFLRKHLLLKGMPIHFLFCNKAFDSCFEHLLFRSEMMVLCLLITKAVPGAWSLIPRTTAPAAPSSAALGAGGCVLLGRGGDKRLDFSPLEEMNLTITRSWGVSGRHWVPTPRDPEVKEIWRAWGDPGKRPVQLTAICTAHSQTESHLILQDCGARCLCSLSGIPWASQFQCYR